jgi:hypothetical protein
MASRRRPKLPCVLNDYLPNCLCPSPLASPAVAMFVSRREGKLNSECCILGPTASFFLCGGASQNISCFLACFTLVLISFYLLQAGAWRSVVVVPMVTHITMYMCVLLV